MLHWCGFGSRRAPLEFWQVFLVRTWEEIVRVSGLYRRPESPRHLGWLGRFANHPRFRRKGFGSAAIHRLVDRARTIGCNELWVYTGASDKAARYFYTKLGFEVLGSARSCATGQTMGNSDIALKLRLDAY
jgi:GNAT superfamily N-acetyltransferase